MIRERGEGGACPAANVELPSPMCGPNEAGLSIALAKGGDGAKSESLLQRGLAFSDPPSSASFDDDEMGEAARPCKPVSDGGMVYRKFDWSSGSRLPLSNPGGQSPSSSAGGDEDDDDMESSGSEGVQGPCVNGRSSDRIGTTNWLDGGDGSSGGVGNTLVFSICVWRAAWILACVFPPIGREVRRR
jgi:hypothetical protein